MVDVDPRRQCHSRGGTDQAPRMYSVHNSAAEWLLLLVVMLAGSRTARVKSSACRIAQVESEHSRLLLEPRCCTQQ